jgi:multidrug efflux pump
MYTQVNQYHVILEADPRFQQNPGNLHDLYIQGSTSGTVAAVASATAGSSSGAGAGGGAAASNSLLNSASSTSGTSLSNTPGVLNLASNNTTSSGANSTSALSSASIGGGSASVLSGSSGSVSSQPASASNSRTAAAGGGSSSGASATGGSTPVPLSAFLHMQTQNESLSIGHQGQFPVVTLSFNLGAGYSLGQALDSINKVIAKEKMPASVIADFQGTAAAYQSSQSNEGILILAALVTVYIVLGVLYESFIHPVTILSTLPSAGVGALLALRLFGLDLDIVGIIGIILLIGIVQKNGIMMVDFALELERKEHKETTEAIYQAALLRLRPILMTTLAALLSGVPLAFGTGIGSELRKPLGVAMVGGLLFSQVLTLYTTPVIYIFFDKLAARFSRRRREEAENTQAEGGVA